MSERGRITGRGLLGLVACQPVGLRADCAQKAVSHFPHDPRRAALFVGMSMSTEVDACPRFQPISISADVRIWPEMRAKEAEPSKTRSIDCRVRSFKQLFNLFARFKDFCQ